MRSLEFSSMHVRDALGIADLNVLVLDGGMTIDVLTSEAA